VPQAGLALGAALQLVWVAALPLGKSRPLDYQAAGVAAILGYKAIAPSGAGEGRVLFLALCLAVVGAVLGEVLDSVHKRLNNKLFAAGVAAASPSGTVGCHLAGVGTAWVRGFVVAGLVTGLALYAARLAPGLPEFSRAEVLGVTLAIGVAGAVRMFVSVKRVPWFAAGGAVAGALWVVFGKLG
jgi:mannose/fructose/N-acetylgalactosamine-specific phosphotransferase system component IIC